MRKNLSSMMLVRALNPRPRITAVRNWMLFHVERFLLRGTFHRLLVIGVLIALLSITAGLLLTAVGGAPDGVNPFWWAFLRMTDPGYLGDDEGTWPRTISTTITILGTVLFTGAMIAILTQWLHETIEKLERGLTPIQRRNHILVLGWTNRTPSLVREIMQSEARVVRFLLTHNARRLAIVVLAEEVRTALADQLREELGGLYSITNIILRSGTPLRLDHLHRVAVLDAASIVLPGAEHASQANFSADASTIKTILTISNAAHEAGRRPPFLVAEIFDARKIPTARAAYLNGHVEILASDVVISRVLTQIIRNGGLSAVYNEILTIGLGNEILVPPIPSAVGRTFRELEGAFTRAVLMGIARKRGNDVIPYLNPPDDFVIEEGDRLVVLARSYADYGNLDFSIAPRSAAKSRLHKVAASPARRVLLLGWNHRAAALLQQLDSFVGELFHVDFLSRVPAAVREKAFIDHGFTPQRIKLRHIEGDYVVLSDLSRLDLASYTTVVFLGSDRHATEEEADARTILGYLLVAELLEGASPRPALVVELMDAENESLFHDRPGEIVVSPLILSHIMSQVALRPELFAVFEELLGTTGPEIAFFPASEYDLTGREIDFREVKELVASCGEIALGIRRSDVATNKKTILLNPVSVERFALAEQDEIVVLVTNHSPSES